MRNAFGKIDDCFVGLYHQARLSRVLRGRLFAPRVPAFPTPITRTRTSRLPLQHSRALASGPCRAHYYVLPYRNFPRLRIATGREGATRPGPLVDHPRSPELTTQGSADSIQCFPYEQRRCQPDSRSRWTYADGESCVRALQVGNPIRKRKYKRDFVRACLRRAFDTRLSSRVFVAHRRWCICDLGITNFLGSGSWVYLGRSRGAHRARNSRFYDFRGVRNALFTLVSTARVKFRGIVG